MVRYGTPAARWVLLATVLGSGIAFLDGTVVNVALPTISEDLHTSLAGLQWTLDAYLVTLSALLLLGGSLGDRYGRRRMFVAGLAGFTLASLLCGLAPTANFLIGARALQGVGGALLVPGSLSIISSTFHHDDRGRAIGAWSGLAGIAGALGPFLGGWLIGAASWRLIFLINVPLAAAAIVITLRHVPETSSPEQGGLDVPGAALVTVGLAGIAYAAIERNGMASVVAAAVGVAAVVGFLVRERVTAHPMLPLGIFRSRQFTGANLTTFAVYAGLGGALFLVVLRLQVSLGYDPLEAGASLVPFTVLMLLVSPAAGQLGQRVGPRLPMTVGPLVAGVGLALFGQISPGGSYATSVLPAVVIFGLGMALTVAPLTAAVLGSVADTQAGIASGVNNAVARLAGLLAVAVLPALAGIATDESLAASLDTGYSTALRISAGLCAAGGLISALFVRDAARVRATVHPAVSQACGDPCVETVSAAGR
ncbi:MAG TPA: MFS transporter [Acidimicrobiales bacterium]|nr:MFS transporter [Acidimicrobiales bacterium]